MNPVDIFSDQVGGCENGLVHPEPPRGQVSIQLGTGKGIGDQGFVVGEQAAVLLAEPRSVQKVNSHGAVGPGAIYGLRGPAR